MDDHACYRATSTDGFAVHCWGSNAGLAIDESDDTTVFPPRALADVNLSADVEHLAVASTSTCVAEDGEVFCRGTITANVPVDQALPQGRRAAQVATGRQHVCALDEAGAVWCAGNNALGQLGREGAPEGFVQVELPEPVERVVAERESTCALTADGVWCWGRNSNGQVRPSGQASELPTKADLGDPASVSHLAMGLQTTCAITSDFSLICWGGSLCDALTFSGYQRVENLDLAAVEPSALAVGRDFVCVVSGDGRVLCAGNDELGQLGGGPSAQACVTSLQEVAVNCD